MNKNIINNAQLLEIKTKIRQLGAMMNAYQCRFVVSSGQLFFVDDEYAVPLFKAGAEWRINSVWHSITVIPDCHRFIVFLPKKSTIGSKNPIMGILEENRTFISSRPGCILCRLDEMESWAYLDDLLP